MICIALKCMERRLSPDMTMRGKWTKRATWRHRSSHEFVIHTSSKCLEMSEGRSKYEEMKGIFLLEEVIKL